MFLFNSLFKIFGWLLFVFMIVFTLQRYYNAQSTTTPVTLKPGGSTTSQNAQLNSSEKENYFNKIYDKTWVYIQNSDMKELNADVFSKNQAQLLQLFKDKINQKAPYKNNEKFIPVDPKYAQHDIKIAPAPSLATGNIPGKQ